MRPDGIGPAPLDARLGLNVPYEWWPGAATLKGIEAAGFAWVQVPAPPVEMLADPRHAVRHATALRRSLEVTDLDIVVHGPTNLQLGSALHDRAFEGLLEYAHHIGAELRRLPRAGLRPAWRRVGGGGSGAAPALAHGRGARRAGLSGEPLPGVSRPVERLPRPAVGPRPREAARHPDLRDAARRRACPRGGGLHGRRDR